MLCLSGFELYSRWVPLIIHRLNNWSLVTCSYHCAKRFHFFSFEIAR